MKLIIRLLAVVTMLGWCGTTALAQSPSTIFYQGRLTNAAGDPITLQQEVTFTIYPSSSSPLVLWQETMLISPDAQGVFTTTLGTVTTLTNSIFNGLTRYLALKVGTDSEMLPRQVLTSVPYAINATNLPNGSVTSDKIATGAVVTEALADEAVTTEKVADDNLTAQDLLDEPGLAFKMSLPANLYKPLPTSGTDTLASITITVPSAGYVYVWGMTNVSFDHLNGTRDWFWCQISAVPDTIIPNSYGFGMIDIPAEQPTNSSYIIPVNVHRPFEVIDGGTFTYYFNAKMFSGGGNSDQYHSLQLTAMYFPTAYGVVSQNPPPATPDDGDTNEGKQ
jgi:hypothetical protein